MEEDNNIKYFEHNVKKIENLKFSIGIPLNVNQSKEVNNILKEMGELILNMNVRNKSNYENIYNDIKGCLICTGSISADLIGNNTIDEYIQNINCNVNNNNIDDSI